MDLAQNLANFADALRLLAMLNLVLLMVVSVARYYVHRAGDAKARATNSNT